MCSRTLKVGVPLLSLALMLFSAGDSFAQRRGGGGFHGGGAYHGGEAFHDGGHAYYGGRGYYGDHGYYGGYGRYGWGGFGYGLGVGVGLGWGWPGYGGWGYGYGYPGYYTDYDNYPNAYPERTAGYYDPQLMPGAQVGKNPTGSQQQNVAYIRVLVPANAKVWFNGSDTAVEGDQRVFTTPELQPGKSYKYEVKAQWNVNGKVVTRTKEATFHPGDGVTVNFTS